MALRHAEAWDHYRVFGPVRLGEDPHGYLVMFTADDNPKEAYLLTGLKSLELAQCHDRGEIVFTQGGPTGGYWDWLPETPNTEKQP